MKKIIGVIIGVLLFIVVCFLVYELTGNKNLTKRINVYFDDLSISVVGNTKYTKPSINNTVMNDFFVAFSENNESISFEFSIINGGNVSMKLSDIVYDFSYDKNLASYELCYLDGSLVKKGDVLSPGTYKRVILKYTNLKDGELELRNLGLLLIYSEM